MISVLIPSRNEKYLVPTIRDVRQHCSDVEIVVGRDGYLDQPDLPRDDRMIVRSWQEPVGMRQTIRRLVEASHGEFLLKLDAHCSVSDGFAEKLASVCGPGDVVIPRRYRLDGTSWQWRMDTANDYEYFIFPQKYNPPALHGYRWEARNQERGEVALDETLTFQGSSWMMRREHFERHQFFSDPGYEGLPMQEAEEIGLTTWTHGGRVLACKAAPYAHWYKSKEVGRGYLVGKDESRRCYAYSYQHWVVERWKAFQKVIEHFWPIPGWPNDWRERLYT